MKRTKKNNKGFSLVELIVVVLIMAIIAVALAPQIMKWVGTSRENTDVHTFEQMKSNAEQLSLELQANGTSKDDIDFTITIKNDGTTISNYANEFASLVPGYGDTKTKNGNKTMTITVENGGVKTLNDGSGTTGTTEGNTEGESEGE